MASTNRAPNVDQELDFETLFRASYERLVRSIGLATGDFELAADSVQEAFARAHAKWKQVGRYASPIGWIRTVALNTARDQQRRNRRFDRLRHLLLRAESSEVHHEPHTPLTDALATLSPQQRIAATLFYLDDLSVSDVAAAMKLSEGAVKFHLSKARDHLRPFAKVGAP
jgi:RNA polymerase sigma-70 factor, ECF subfamily